MDVNDTDYKYVNNLEKKKSAASAILLGIGLAGLVDIAWEGSFVLYSSLN